MAEGDAGLVFCNIRPIRRLARHLRAMSTVHEPYLGLRELLHTLSAAALQLQCDILYHRDEAINSVRHHTDRQIRHPNRQECETLRSDAPNREAEQFERRTSDGL